MNILKLVKKDFISFFKVKSAVLLTFLVPMILTLIFGAVFGGFGDKETVNEITVLAVDKDNSEASQKLLNKLDALETFELKREYTKDEEKLKLTQEIMDKNIKNGNYKIGLLIEAGFSESISQGKKAKIRIHADPKYNIEYNVLKGVLQKTFMQEFPQTIFTGMFNQALSYLGEEKGNRFKKSINNVVENYFIPDEAETDAEKEEEAQTNVMQNMMDNSIDIELVKLLGEDQENPMFAQYVAGLAVMFLLFSVTHAGSTLLEEKNDGTINRLLISPVTKSEILFSKMVFISLLGLIQLIVLFIFGWLVFGLNIFKDIPALLTVMVVTALAAASIGIFIASLCKNQQQVSGLSTLIILGMSALGGSMFPSFIMPAYIQFIGKFTLNYWAMKGFTDIFWRNLHLADIWISLAVLAGITIVFSTIAINIFSKRISEFS